MLKPNKPSAQIEAGLTKSPDFVYPKRAIKRSPRRPAKMVGYQAVLRCRVAAMARRSVTQISAEMDSAPPSSAGVMRLRPDPAIRPAPRCTIQIRNTAGIGEG